MRHVAFTTRSLLASTVLVASLAIAGIAVAERAATAEVATTAPAVALVEVPVCWGTPTTGTVSSDSAMVQIVTVRVEPTSLLRLDADGHVEAAATNTGCAPRSTDHLFIVQKDGSLVDFPDFHPESVAWTGDFTQFGFIPQD